MNFIIRMLAINASLGLLMLAFNYLQEPDYFGDVDLLPLLVISAIAGFIVSLALGFLDRSNNDVDH